MSPRPSSLELGRSGEEYALRYLAKKKYKIAEKSFHFSRGEIDIVAYDGKTLVFIEVKTRSGQSHGTPEEAVMPSKQQQIRKIAQAYLTMNKLEGIPCRFDVLSLEHDENKGFKIKHFVNAFE